MDVHKVGMNCNAVVLRMHMKSEKHFSKKCKRAFNIARSDVATMFGDLFFFFNAFASKCFI